MSNAERLTSILRVRRITEDTARADLARAQRDEAEAERLLAERRRRAAQTEPPASAPLPAEVLRSMHLRGMREQEQIRLAEQEHARNVERRREALRELQQASVERRSLEKLVQRRSAEAIAARRAAADRALDEMVTLQHGRAVTS